MLDGSTLGIPAFDLVARVHPTAKQFHIDNGENWVFQPLDSEWQYTRAIVPRPDNDAVLFLTNGNGPPGNAGKLLRSTDHGETWQALTLPGKLNSTPWCVSTHAHDPMLVLMATNLGQLYRSTDGGDSWERLPHEFGEVRALHWRPVDYPPTRPKHSITVRPVVLTAPSVQPATGLQPA